MSSTMFLRLFTTQQRCKDDVLGVLDVYVAVQEARGKEPNLKQADRTRTRLHLKPPDPT